MLSQQWLSGTGVLTMGHWDGASEHAWGALGNATVVPNLPPALNTVMLPGDVFFINVNTASGTLNIEWQLYGSRLVTTP